MEFDLVRILALRSELGISNYPKPLKTLMMALEDKMRYYLPVKCLSHRRTQEQLVKE